MTAAEVGQLTREQVVAFVGAADTQHAQAVLVPDTAMHTLEMLPELESTLGKSVLTANQVTVWEGLRLLGAVPALPRLGRLFTAAPADDTP